MMSTHSVGDSFWCILAFSILRCQINFIQGERDLLLIKYRVIAIIINPYQNLVYLK